MLIDAHCHLEDKQFDKDLDEVIERAKKANVAIVICNGLNKKDNEKILTISTILFNRTYYYAFN